MNEGAALMCVLAWLAALPCAAPGQTNEGGLLSRAESSNCEETSRLLEQ
ncbi:MAG TPA: hypothetical protein VN765_16210 [Candidatus Acidoferrum sp.]|nr:hypothetical protein [Candidatus Acidoferrum sp.]